MSAKPQWLRGPRSWTLRTRLLVALMALLAAVSVVIGVVSVASLDRFLLGRVDAQLDAAGGRSQAAFGAPPRDDDGAGGHGEHPNQGPGFLDARGQAEGTLGAQITSGQVGSAAVIDKAGGYVALSADQMDAIAAVPVDAKPHSVDLGGDLGNYRVQAARAPDGDVLITGLPLGDLHATVYWLTAVVTGVAVLGLLAAVLAGAAILKFTLRPLRRIADTASRVAELPLARGEVALAVRVPESDTDPRTEVGQVGSALNRMLGHIGAALTARQASETRVRQFVADASHELRTPLAAIRGYAELARRSRDSVPPDIAHALRRVESEAVRMTELVEDLLLLARLDSGRPVEHREVELSRLMVDAVSDAHAAGPEHHWQLELPDEPVAVKGDPDRLHQVLANLLANARTHTPPGTAVTATLSTSETSGDAGSLGEAVVRVVDNGPGIPAGLVPDVFERFSRGDSSRSHAAGSTGLGLAIVAAVVHAHRGIVDVASKPGRTVFTVRLPLNA